MIFNIIYVFTVHTHITHAHTFYVFIPIQSSIYLQYQSPFINWRHFALWHDTTAPSLDSFADYNGNDLVFCNALHSLNVHRKNSSQKREWIRVKCEKTENSEKIYLLCWEMLISNRGTSVVQQWTRNQHKTHVSSIMVCGPWQRACMGDLCVGRCWWIHCRPYLRATEGKC